MSIREVGGQPASYQSAAGSSHAQACATHRRARTRGLDAAHHEHVAVGQRAGARVPAGAAGQGGKASGGAVSTSRAAAAAAGAAGLLGGRGLAPLLRAAPHLGIIFMVSDLVL